LLLEIIPIKTKDYMAIKDLSIYLPLITRVKFINKNLAFSKLMIRLKLIGLSVNI